jgi:hypothetical protein
MIQWLLCRLPYPLWFHKPIVIEVYDGSNRKLQCVACKRYFGMSDIHQAVLPWDEEYESIICLIYGLPRTKV